MSTISSVAASPAIQSKPGKGATQSSDLPEPVKPAKKEAASAEAPEKKPHAESKPPAEEGKGKKLATA